MTLVQTKDLTGLALDYAAAVTEGGTDFLFDGITWGFNLGGKTKVLAKGWGTSMSYCPSTDWSRGGPIIERELIDVKHLPGIGWIAETPPDFNDQSETGPTPLIAAMRCYVASKLGETIDIPQELLS